MLRSSLLSLVLLNFISLLPSIKSVEVERESLEQTHGSGHRAEYGSQLQNEPILFIDKIMKVVTPAEVELIKGKQPMTVTPLTLEKRLHDAWLLGNDEVQQDFNEMKKKKSGAQFFQYQAEQIGQDDGKFRKLTLADNKFSVDLIMEINKNNSFAITKDILIQQLTWAYQIGSLHSVNKFIGTQYVLPEIEKADKENLEHFKKLESKLIEMGKKDELEEMNVSQYGQSPSGLGQSEQTFDYRQILSPLFPGSTPISYPSTISDTLPFYRGTGLPNFPQTGF